MMEEIRKAIMHTEAIIKGFLFEIQQALFNPIELA